MAKVKTQSILQLESPTNENRLIIQFVESDTDEKFQIVELYDSLTTEEKAVVDAYKTLCETLMNK